MLQFCLQNANPVACCARRSVVLRLADTVAAEAAAVTAAAADAGEHNSGDGQAGSIAAASSGRATHRAKAAEPEFAGRGSSSGGGAGAGPATHRSNKAAAVSASSIASPVLAAAAREQLSAQLFDAVWAASQAAAGEVEPAVVQLAQAVARAAGVAHAPQPAAEGEAWRVFAADRTLARLGCTPL
jgi:hypothetical protein